MKKKLVCVMCLLLSAVLFVGCGPLTDASNHNFSKDGVAMLNENGEEVEREVFTNNDKNAHVYYDINSYMASVAASDNVQGIVQDSVDAITKTWNDVDVSLYTIGNSTVESQPSVSYINNIAAASYNGNDTDVLTKAIDDHTEKSGDKIIDPRIKLIITDLAPQLMDYQGLAKHIKENVIDANKSFSILSVNTTTPFFIIAIGGLKDLSDYITSFYSMPNISAFVGTVDWTGMDREYKINCKMYPQNGGVLGVDYDKTTAIEQGEYVVDANGNVQSNNMQIAGEAPPPPPQNGGQPPAGQPPQGGMPKGAPPQALSGMMPEIPGGMQVRIDDLGSFNILRPNYGSDKLKTAVEGTVNFGPDDTTDLEVEVPTDYSKADVSVDDIKIFKYKSLLWNGTSDMDQQTINSISGKLKLDVVFDSIPQIQLSNLSFGVSTQYFDANKGDSEFFESKNDVKNNIEVAYASNVSGPFQSQLRIDNVDKTAMINVYVTSLAKLSKVTKLDINFTAYDPGFVPEWANSWSLKSGYSNIANFISLLNDYNASDNQFDETLTLYLAEGDEETYEQTDKEDLPNIANLGAVPASAE